MLRSQSHVVVLTYATAGFIHAEPDAVVTLEGFGTVLNRYLALDSTQKYLHPQANFKRWLFNADGTYSLHAFYNNFGETSALDRVVDSC